MGGKFKKITDLKDYIGELKYFKNYFPVLIIISTCLLSVFPSYEATVFVVLIFYAIFMFFVFSLSAEKMSFKRFVYANYFFASICGFALINSSIDITKYYGVENIKSKYIAEYENGDNEAALKLARYLQTLKRSDLATGHNFYKIHAAYPVWLEKYVQARIEKDGNVDNSIFKELGHFFIRGLWDRYSSKKEDVDKGKKYYKMAAKRGDQMALAQMEFDLKQANRIREQDVIRNRNFERQKQATAERERKKKLEESKKSFSEKLGEGWGRQKRRANEAWEWVSKPFAEAWKDFERGEQRSKQGR